VAAASSESRRAGLSSAIALVGRALQADPQALTDLATVEAESDHDVETIESLTFMAEAYLKIAALALGRTPEAEFDEYAGMAAARLMEDEDDQ
jgi:hypothetical protein